jgi:hypothetical protein
MEIFNNRQRSGYEEIVSYGPHWLTEYREMDAVYQFAGWTLDLMAYWLERTVNNQFPTQADEQAIKIFEQVLNLEPDPEDTLEERRRTVAAYYSGTGKLSRSTIQSMIQTYSGCNSELWWNALTLQIRIFCDEDGKFSQKKIYDILSRRMPAHIGFSVRNVLCGFEFQEEVAYKAKYRIGFSWWNGSLDGRYVLNGSAVLSTVFPPDFAIRTHLEIETPLKFENVIFAMRILFDTELNTETKPVYRFFFNWWEESRTLDGTEMMDGQHMLDQDSPPSWTHETYRMDLEIEEKFLVSMYIPGKAMLLDGTTFLDGNIKLNSGREVL